MVAVDEADFTFERAVILQFGRSITAGWLHFVVSTPAELDGIAIAGAMDGAREAIEGELAADLIEAAAVDAAVAAVNIADRETAEAFEALRSTDIET